MLNLLSGALQKRDSLRLSILRTAKAILKETIC